MASRKTKFPWAWLFIGLLVCALVGLGAYVLLTQRPAPVETYNGFPVMQGTCPGTERTCYFVNLTIKKQPYTLTFYNEPSSVERIGVAPEAVAWAWRLQRVVNGTVILTVPKTTSGEVGIATVALAQILGSRYNMYNLHVQGAVNTATTCLNATPSTLIIRFEQASVSGVAMDGPNCLAIYAQNDSDVIAVAEAYAYRLIGVIPMNQNATNTTLLHP